MKKEAIEECYKKAKECIERNKFVGGIFASPGYHAIWARDSMISLIGASVNKEFKDIFRKSLITMASYQSEKGQIPNAVDKWSKRKEHVDYQSIDSTLWFVIGEYWYKKIYNDSSLFNEHKRAIEKALVWLSYQDFSESGLIAQLPTTDWQDAFPHKYGHTINTQALYYHALNLAGKIKEAERLKFLVNEDSEHKLWNGNFYLAYRWKNHNKYKEKGEWFDSLGNLLAIIFELAGKNRAEKIIHHIKEKRINEPYSLKAIYPPIKKGDKDWQDYYLDCDAGKPFHYLNGGIWLYIGSFYVLALIKLKKFIEAEKELRKLAEANLNGNFPEWINPLTKESHGNLQAWNAGMYILAYESFKNKKCLI